MMEVYNRTRRWAFWLRGKTALGKSPPKIKTTPNKALTVIAQGTLVKGTFEEAGEIVIHGSFEGKISSSASLTVAPSGVVDAVVTSRHIYINGQVRGTVHTPTLYLDAHAQFVGDLYTSSLQIIEGAIFQGSCTMPDETRTPEEILAPAAVTTRTAP